MSLASKGYISILKTRPSARLVCSAVKKAVADWGVPGQITLENGWVFGGSKNINGKEDESGQIIVHGFASLGCTVYHHQPGNPTSKADIESIIHALSRLFKRQPGYTGNCERFSSSDSFRREERDINAGRVEAVTHRMNFSECATAVLNAIAEYNLTPQPYGRLGGMSPNQAFDAKRSQVPVTKITHQLQFLLDENYVINVGPGGVRFTHYGKPIDVKGGELPQFIGQKLRACVDRTDDTLVTFMTMDYTHVFTVEAMPTPSANEIRIATIGGKVAEGRAKIRSHIKYINSEGSRLREKHGNTRQDILTEIRIQPGEETCATERKMIIDPQLVEAGDQVAAQRADVLRGREEAQQQQRRAHQFARQTGLKLPSSGLAKLTPEQIRKLESFRKQEETT